MLILEHLSHPSWGSCRKFLLPSELLLQSQPHSELERQTALWIKSPELLGDPSTVFVDTELLGESHMSQGRLRGRSQEVEEKGDHLGN